MKQIKRNECAILPLVLKGQWYDMIDSGEKKEEYRDAKPFWTKRLDSWTRKTMNKSCDWHKGVWGKHRVVAFSRGYKKTDMFFIVNGVINSQDEPPWIEHAKWGKPATPHYIILLGERVELVD